MRSHLEVRQRNCIFWYYEQLFYQHRNWLHFCPKFKWKTKRKHCLPNSLSNVTLIPVGIIWITLHWKTSFVPCTKNRNLFAWSKSNSFDWRCSRSPSRRRGWTSRLECTDRQMRHKNVDSKSTLSIRLIQSRPVSTNWLVNCRLDLRSRWLLGWLAIAVMEQAEIARFGSSLEARISIELVESIKQLTANSTRGHDVRLRISEIDSREIRNGTPKSKMNQSNSNSAESH